MGGRSDLSVSHSPPVHLLSHSSGKSWGYICSFVPVGCPRSARGALSPYQSWQLAYGSWAMSKAQFFLLTRQRLEPIVFFLSQLPATTRLGFVITQCSLAGCNTLFRSLISSRLSQPDGKQWTPPKVMRKVTLNTHPSVRANRWAVRATSELCSLGEPAAAGQAPGCFWVPSPARPHTSQGVLRHYCVCMLLVSALQLGSVLYTCMLGRLCVAVASVHG